MRLLLTVGIAVVIVSCHAETFITSDTGHKNEALLCALALEEKINDEPLPDNIKRLALHRLLQPLKGINHGHYNFSSMEAATLEIKSTSYHWLPLIAVPGSITIKLSDFDLNDPYKSKILFKTGIQNQDGEFDYLGTTECSLEELLTAITTYSSLQLLGIKRCEETKYAKAVAAADKKFFLFSEQRKFWKEKYLNLLCGTHGMLPRIFTIGSLPQKPTPECKRQTI